MNFKAKKVLKRIQNKDLTTETTIPERFIAGATAGFISQTAVYPLDVMMIVILISIFFFEI
jgi:hypothetical protein